MVTITATYAHYFVSMSVFGKLKVFLFYLNLTFSQV